MFLKYVQSHSYLILETSDLWFDQQCIHKILGPAGIHSLGSHKTQESTNPYSKQQQRNKCMIVWLSTWLKWDDISGSVSVGLGPQWDKKLKRKEASELSSALPGWEHVLLLSSPMDIRSQLLQPFNRASHQRLYRRASRSHPQTDTHH